MKHVFTHKSGLKVKLLDPLIPLERDEHGILWFEIFGGPFDGKAIQAKTSELVSVVSNLDPEVGRNLPSEGLKEEEE